MDIATALDHARSHPHGILATIKRDGRPQLSNIIHSVGDDDLIRISLTIDRAKSANIRRDPRVSLHVGADTFWSYLVIEGRASLGEVVTDAHGPAADALVELYRAIAGEHDDWEDYRQALVRDGRLIATVTPERAYGMWS